MVATSAEAAGLRIRARPLLALSATLAAALGVAQLARVDTNLGAPFGPDRRMRLLDATASTYPGREAIARAVLADRPIDGRAYRVLALQRDATGQGGDARKLLRIAVRRWPRDPATRAFLADQALAAGDANSGLEHLDALLRVAPWTREQILPLLTPHLADARVRDALVARLALDPPWRNAFAQALRADTTPPREAEVLLAALARRVPLTPAEWQSRIAVLERVGLPAHARTLWLSTLDARARMLAGNVFDGGFEAPGIEGGYAWQFTPSPGVTIDHDPIAPYAGSRSLAIAFSGRAIAFAGVTQALVLAPGAYRFESAARDDTGSARPFEWRIACADGRVLGAFGIEARGRWQRQAGAFEVGGDCVRQTLQLRHTSRSLAERQLEGALRIDALGIFPSR